MKMVGVLSWGTTPMYVSGYERDDDDVDESDDDDECGGGTGDDDDDDDEAIAAGADYFDGENDCECVRR